MQNESLPAVKDVILEALSMQKFTKRKQLIQTIISRGYVISDRVMRLAVENLILKDHIPIQSSEKGYSIITTPEELEEAKQYLQEKIESLAIRKNSLAINFYHSKDNLLKPDDNQIRLFI